MPIVGNRKSTTPSMGRGYRKDPMTKFAAVFQECASDILSESGVDLFQEPAKAMMFGNSNNAMKRFFMEDAVDVKEIETLYPDAEEAEEVAADAEQMMEEQFLNDREAVLEYANLGSYNPVIGMSFPIHKNILLNNIFDKGAIPKVVAREPKFTLSMETRMLIAPDGTEIDMFKEQYKMRAAIDSTAPFVTIEMTLPQAEGATDILAAISASSEDHLSIESYVSAVKVEVYLMTGDVNPETGEIVTADGPVQVWIPVRVPFSPSYGEYDRSMMEPIVIDARDPANPAEYIQLKDVLAGYMKKDNIMISNSTGVVTDIRFSARIDTSSAMVNTCSVTWKVRTDIVEIPSAIPINTTVSPEEVKDVAALYNVNQLSKILSLIKTTLGNYKDDKIKMHLDESFQTMPASNKLATTFDFAPRADYAFDHVEWRHKTFFDFLDIEIGCLFQVLNDPNMTVSIFGSPELVRRVTPTEYTYQTPSNIGPVELDFVKTVVTSDKRVYQFVGSDKLRGNSNFIIVLCPRNSDRIIYRIYDYQMYVGNEIRNMKNYALPAIHAFERWKFVEYQPVQGRCKILNPSGLTNIASNDDPIGTSQMNDFNMFVP